MYYPGVLLAPIMMPAFLLIAVPQAACADAASCRDAAISAATEGNFETFHDLAWRAAQKGRPNDPELMYMLARAQSLSGRPGDSLVMLRRLAQMGIATDARDNEDFRRVRALAGWADLDKMLTAAGGNAPSAAVPMVTARPVPAEPPVAAPPKAVTPPKARNVTAPASPKASYSPAPAAGGGGVAAMRLTGSALEPIGLAYDNASRRFVLGDRQDNKLMVADEVFDHVNDLIGAASGGFGILSAVEIDARRGDLWVTSSSPDGAAAIHKLQLVSGRVLREIKVPAALQPVVLSDFAVTDAGALLLVDARGGRLLRVTPAGGRFERPFNLNLSSPSSIAPADGVAYVAHDRGLSVVDVASGHVTEVRAAAGVTLAGLRRVRWSRGTLLGLQGDEESARLVRIRFGRGRHLAIAVEPLDGDIESAGTALTISRDAAYYIAHADGGTTIRRVRLR